MTPVSMWVPPYLSIYNVGVASLGLQIIQIDTVHFLAAGLKPEKCKKFERSAFAQLLLFSDVLSRYSTARGSTGT